MVVESVQQDVVQCNHVILSTRLEEVHLIVACKQYVSMELIKHLRITFVRAFSSKISRCKAKIDESYFASLTIYHDVIWLQVVEYNRRLMHCLQNLNELYHHFKNLFGSLDTLKRFKVSNEVDIQPRHDNIAKVSLFSLDFLLEVLLDAIVVRSSILFFI